MKTGPPLTAAILDVFAKLVEPLPPPCTHSQSLNGCTLNLTPDNLTLPASFEDARVEVERPLHLTGLRQHAAQSPRREIHSLKA